MGCVMHSIHRCERIDFSAERETDCYDYGIRSSASLLVEELLAGSSGHLPDDVSRLGVEAMAAASFRRGHRGFCWMVYYRLDVCQPVAAEIWHTGLGRGVNN